MKADQQNYEFSKTKYLYVRKNKSKKIIYNKLIVLFF